MLNCYTFHCNEPLLENAVYSYTKWNCAEHFFLWSFQGQAHCHLQCTQKEGVLPHPIFRESAWQRYIPCSEFLRIARIAAYRTANVIRSAIPYRSFRTEYTNFLYRHLHVQTLPCSFSFIEGLHTRNTGDRTPSWTLAGFRDNEYSY